MESEIEKKGVKNIFETILRNVSEPVDGNSC